MVEISTLSRKRTGPAQLAGVSRWRFFSRSGRMRNRPGSAGTRVSFSSADQAGWVKSPVPSTLSPLRSAHQDRCSMSQSLLQARENFEWMCRSAWNISVLILPRPTVSHRYLRPAAGGGFWSLRRYAERRDWIGDRLMPDALYRVMLADGTSHLATGEPGTGPAALAEGLSLDDLLAGPAAEFWPRLAAAPRRDLPGQARVVAPVESQEVWAAG